MMEVNEKEIHSRSFLRRSGKDRRALRDRRKILHLDFYKWGGIDQRQGKELRQRVTERRQGWVRVGAWKSVYVGRKDA